MKKLFLSLIFALSLFIVNAQVVISITTDTVQGAETVYFSTTAIDAIDAYEGYVGYYFTKTDIADSCSVIQLQGSFDKSFVTYVNLTGNAQLTSTTTDGNYFLYDSSPKYFYYRLRATCAAGDTVKFTNVKAVVKKVQKK